MPEFGNLYNAVETASDDYSFRTRANVRDSDGTIWFGEVSSPGARATLESCRHYGKPHVIVPCVRSPGPETIRSVLYWIGAAKIRTLNIAGNRESTNPGLGELVESFLIELLNRLPESRPV